MQECLQLFQTGLKQKPDDPFLQCGVTFLSTGSSPVAWLYEICYEEIKKHLGPEAKPPYSCQKGWIHNVSLAKVMVAWALNGRQGVPQKLSRQKADVGSSAAASQSFPPINQLFTASLSPQATTTSLEDNINSAAWWILEQELQLPPGSGPQCIQHLANKLHNTTNSTATPPSPVNTKNINPVTKEHKPPSQPVRYHDSQEDIANELFNALQLAPGYSHYDEIDFRIIVPPKTSLKLQTRERLISLLWKLCIPAFHADRATLEHLIAQTLKQEQQQSILDKTNRYDPNNKAWSLLNTAQAYFSQRVMSSCMFRKGEPNHAFQSLCQAVYHVNPTTGKRKMMLVIADESHYGLKRNGQVDILFNGAQYSSTSSFNPTNNFPNSDNVLSEPNVFIVSISATGWNCNVVPYHRVVTWKDPPANYISRESYLNGSNNKDKLLVSQGFDALVQRYTKVQWLHGDINRLLPSICLMVDYALAFVATAGAINPAVVTSRREEGEGLALPTPETLQIVKHMAASASTSSIKENKTDVIMIRLQPNGIQSVFVSWLKAFRSLLLLQSSPANQSQQQEQYKIICPEISELPFHDSFETSLKGHRSICIVVEKARMGDTIPGLTFFDLRARYKSKGVHASSASSFASFTQDVARAFGYRATAPTIILNRQGYQLFLGQTNHLDHYLQRTKVPISELSQVIGVSAGNEVENESVLFPNALSMWHRVLFAASLHDVQAIKVLHHVQNNRILLLARSQIGKTGSFIRF